MQLLRHTDSVPDSLKRGVAVLGNFDGVHRGHQAVIDRATAIARALPAPSVLVTFEPHPVSFFRPDTPPFRLTPLRAKAHYLQALGLDGLMVLSFDRDLAALEARAFAQRVLIDALAVVHVVVGYDFCFGRNRGGNAALLREIGAEAGFAVTAVDPVASTTDEVYSSTRIRDYLRAGRPAEAAALLGRPFQIEARVAPGDARGRTIGFPTANLELGDYLRPARGVYAVRAGLEGPGGAVDWHDAVANLGVRPTVDGARELLEVHLFDFDGDLYGRHLRVALIDFIRPERKFDGLDALQAQIAADCAAARATLAARRTGAAAS